MGDRIGDIVVSDEAAGVKPGSTVWVSKYALSEGITEKHVDSIGRTDSTWVYVDGWAYSGLKLGRDCHTTQADAIADAERRRVAKIASLGKQVAKLEALTFAADPCIASLGATS